MAHVHSSGHLVFRAILSHYPTTLTFNVQSHIDAIFLARAMHLHCTTIVLNRASFVRVFFHMRFLFWSHDYFDLSLKIIKKETKIGPNDITQPCRFLWQSGMQTDGFQTKLDKTGVFSTGEQIMYESKLCASILWITWLLKSLLLLTYVLSRHWWSYLNKPGTFQSAIIIEHSYLFRLPFFEIDYVPTFYKRVQ